MATLSETTALHGHVVGIEWKSEMASRKNPDGTLSFITVAPGITGIELVAGSSAKRSLILRDAQHEYVFEER